MGFAHMRHNRQHRPASRAKGGKSACARRATPQAARRRQFDTTTGEIQVLCRSAQQAQVAGARRRCGRPGLRVPAYNHAARALQSAARSYMPGVVFQSRKRRYTPRRRSHEYAVALIVSHVECGEEHAQTGAVVICEMAEVFALSRKQ